MSEPPGAGTGKLRIYSKSDPERPLAPRAPIARFYTALVTGDLRSLQVLTERYHQDVNLVFEISRNELQWQVKSQASYGLSGLWALQEQRELSTPLCIAALHGHAESLRHLLRRGADPSLAPGGRGPLHQACLGGHSLCLELLLEYRADPNLRSEEGAAPLHLCTQRGSLRCARLLLRHGAAVDLPSEAGGDTALHVAAERGLWGWGVLEMKAQQKGGMQSLRLRGIFFPCLGNIRDRLGRAASWLCVLLILHQTIKKMLAGLPTAPRMESQEKTHTCLILTQGYPSLERGGVGQTLAAAGACCPSLSPHTVPGQVLQSCAAVPEVIEVLFNSYSQIPISQEWAEAVPEEVFQQHQIFYRSVLGLAGTARSLQHLCRSALRTRLGSRCHSLIPLLPLPKALQDFLLLEPQGVV
ncbi:ASB18 protein, partial [Cisticola juncidis]|nr:ASB18 protein [Cisticola juncidis]